MYRSRLLIEDDSKDLVFSKDVNVECIRADGSSSEKDSQIVMEHEMNLYVNDRLAARLVCTPSFLPEMVLGRLVTSRVIGSADIADMADKGDMADIADVVDLVEKISICDSGHTARVSLCREAEVSLEFTIPKELTSCPANKVFVRNQAAGDLKPLAGSDWSPDDIFRLAGRFSRGSGIHKKTQGTHSAYLYHDGGIIFSAEDIGRHNAMDKVIGYMLLEQIPPRECMVYTTGRVPTDMVEKAIAARIPVLVTKAVPTDQAVEMAKRYNLTLICKAWPDSFEVFNRSF